VGHVIVGEGGLELIHIEPKICARIELYRVGITQDIPLVGKTAPNVPYGGGEGVAGLGLRSIAPEKAGQALPGLGLATMAD
jgi:hypothetical protein